MSDQSNLQDAIANAAATSPRAVRLTEAQQVRLVRACQHPDGRLFDKGNERAIGPSTSVSVASLPINDRRCIEALLNKHMLVGTAQDIATLRLTAAAYEALAIDLIEWPERLRCGVASSESGGAALDDGSVGIIANARPAAAFKLRPGTKGAAVLDLLRRPDGVTLTDMQTATGWQAHSVRGFLSGTVRKRLQLPLVSAKANAGERYYRIVEADGRAELETSEAATCTADRVIAIEASV